MRCLGRVLRSAKHGHHGQVSDHWQQIPKLLISYGKHTATKNPDRCKFCVYWAVVVAQLVERSLPIPEVRGSNPVIGKNLFIYLY